MEGFNTSGILNDNDLQELFETGEVPKQEESQAEEPAKDSNTSEGVGDISALFPESVGGDSDVVVEESREGNPEPKKQEVSPNNFYSSIASALKDEGILYSLQDASKIDNPEAFKQAIEEHISSRLDERQRRIEEALNSGVEPNLVQQYENGIGYLNSITDDALAAEGAEGEQLRKSLIYQDYINRGFSEQRAIKELERSLASGTDIEDAKEALDSNKKFYEAAYKKVLDEAKAKEEADIKAQEERAALLKKDILEGEIFSGIDVSKEIRERALDSIIRPKYRAEDGRQLTELQAYQAQNPEEYIKNVAVLYALTNGFKDINGLVGREVKKNVSSAVKELESKLGGNSFTFGTPQFVGGDKNSSFNADFDIDI